MVVGGKIVFFFSGLCLTHHVLVDKFILITSHNLLLPDLDGPG